MAIKQRLDEEDLALLEVIEDPIFCGEFLRNTNDGSPFQQEWPRKKFEYRHYQKDILTDKSKRILVRGGRAVGKCSPASESVYTEDGFRTIGWLVKNKPAFNVYTLDSNQNFVLRRAIVMPEGIRDYYKVKTVQGKVFQGSGNHPILTDKGYVPVEKLRKGEHKIAVPGFLPFFSTKQDFNWYELRFLGYLFGSLGRKLTPEAVFKLKFKAQILELEMIAKAFNCIVQKDEEASEYRLVAKQRFIKPYARELLYEITDTLYFDKNKVVYSVTPSDIPFRLKEQSNESIKVFLESFLSVFAPITSFGLSVDLQYKGFAYSLQELLYRFGVHSRIEELPIEETKATHFIANKWSADKFYRFTINDPYSLRVLFSTFKIPGLNVEVKEPVHQVENIVYEDIEDIDVDRRATLYHIHVRETNMYISGNGVFVHNSILMEDMMVYDTLNPDIRFVDGNYDQLVTTANMAQLVPVVDRFSRRITSGSIFKGLNPEINRTKGTIDIQNASYTHRIYARIAGPTGEANLIGLHVTSLYIDEAQIFPRRAYYQVLPTINTWQNEWRMILFGVPNGLTNESILWVIDQKMQGMFKIYRIPAHANPFFTKKDNEQALINFGGEESDDYQHLVLGRHGSPAFAVIPRDSMKIEQFPIYSYRFSNKEKELGYIFADFIKTPSIDQKYCSEGLVLAIDTGYTDPSILQIIGKDSHEVWRTLVRYRLTRIPFPEQARIIDFLDRFYDFSFIGIDFGSGGGGTAIAQALQDEKQFERAKQYQRKITGVLFNESLKIGEDPEGKPYTYAMKEFAGNQLSKMVAEKQLVFSELDAEGINQLERVAFQRRHDGTLQFFVVSEQGRSDDDHIFASYIVFVGALTKRMYIVDRTNRIKLLGVRWI